MCVFIEVIELSDMGGKPEVVCVSHSLLGHWWLGAQVH